MSISLDIVRSRTSILSILFAIILLAPLLPLPRPAIPTHLPYRIELLLSVLLATGLILAYRYGRDAVARSADQFCNIGFAFGGFIVWSAASIVWSQYPSAAIHHTLVWITYLIFFFAVPVLVRPGIGLITTAFSLTSVAIALLCILDYAAITDFTLSELTIRGRYARSAEMLVTLSPILWAVAIYSKKHRIPLIIAAALGWITVMLALGKGAFFAGVIGFSLYFIGSGVFGTTAFRKRVMLSAAAWIMITVGMQIGFTIVSGTPTTTAYITGAADPTRTSTTARLFVWKIAGQMYFDNPLIGVGGDNFGLVVNDAGARYREARPTDPNEEIAEVYRIERAHNEPLQVLAELGTVGLLLFLLPFILFAYYFVNTLARRGFRLSPVLWAAVSGLAAFGVSSLVSSHSFRVIQNGVVFFIILGVAVNELTKVRRVTRFRSNPLFDRRVYVLSLGGALCLTAFCVTRLAAEYYAYAGERSESYVAAKANFKAAVAADPDYAGAYLMHAARAAKELDAAEAARLIKAGIDKGIGLSITYSELARMQLINRDRAGAEQTFRAGLRIYPRSIFLRVEYVVFLESEGRTDEARNQMNEARETDHRHANGWYVMITEGSVEAFLKAKSNPDLAAPADLFPDVAVTRYLDSTRPASR